MQFECNVYVPLTYRTYGVAGCYGCARANIGIDLVWCSKGHWCMSTLVPQESDAEDFILCNDAVLKMEKSLSFCENCKLLKNDKCTKGRTLQEIVVRLEYE